MIKKLLKLICLSLTLIVLASFLCSCNGKLEKSSYGDDLQNNEDIHMRTEFPSYKISKDDMPVKLIVSNHTIHEIYSGYYFQIEMKKEDGWYLVPIKYIFIDLAAIIKPGREWEMTIHLEKKVTDYDFKPGEYRIIKNDTNEYLDEDDHSVADKSILVSYFTLY